MLNRLAVGALAAAVVLGAAAPVSAQVVQSVGVNLGALMPRGEDARVENDVWLKNLPVYRFEIKDFTGAEVGGEWNAAFGNHVEVGLATSFYQRTVHTNYRDFVDKDFTEIESDFKLRTIPVSGVVRFLPFGKVGSFQPYVGAGMSVIFWRYSEIGEFIDFNDNNNVYRARYVATGSDAGPVVFGGFRAPIGGDVYGLTLEYRYQFGQGDLKTTDFLGSKIDLGSGSLRAGFLVRF
jgi:outer membrane protein W